MHERGDDTRQKAQAGLSLDTYTLYQVNYRVPVLI